MSMILKLPSGLMANFVFTLLVNILIQGVWATNSILPSPLSTTSCGGILETNSGSLKHGGNGGEAGNCLWIIKLPSTPANSLSVQFQLEKVPPSGRLSLYPQDDYVAGQLTILPIGLSSANESSVVETSGSTVIVVWNAGESSKADSELIFHWDSIKDFKSGVKRPENRLLGGVSYADGSAGSVSWKKPGEYQESVLWVLNSKSGGSMDLQTELELERCDLPDPCLCSYFGVYEVKANSLQAVTTNCGRSVSSNFKGVQTALVVLAFVNPEIRQDSNHITLTWEPSQSDIPTTTARTTLTTENVETTTIVTTDKPPIAHLCPEVEKISPCTCDEIYILCEGSSIVQESVNQMMTELRLVNGVAQNQTLFSTKRLNIERSSMTSFDLTPLLNSRFSQITIGNNRYLSRIHGPLSSSSFDGILQSDESASPYFASIDMDYLFLYSNKLTDAGLDDCFHYFSPSPYQLYVSSNLIQGPSAYNRNKSGTDEFKEFLPGISNFVKLGAFFLFNNPIRLLQGAPFKALGSVGTLNVGCVEEVGEDAFLIDEGINSASGRTIYVASCKTLSDDSFHVNHGLDKWKGRTNFYLWDNNFEFISQEKFEPFLQINGQNTMNLENNRFVCDQRMKWLKDGRESYESRVLNVNCTNDPGYTIFTTSLV